MTEDALRTLMKRKFTAMSMREWCRLTGCQFPHVSEFICEKRGPPTDMLNALNLGIQYIRKRKADRK